MNSSAISQPANGVYLPSSVQRTLPAMQFQAPALLGPDKDVFTAKAPAQPALFGMDDDYMYE